MTNNLDLRLWKLQRTTALLLLPLLIFHVVFQAFFSSVDEITFDATAARLSLAAYLVVDVLLLLAVVTHAILGFRSILQDAAATRDKQRAASWLAVVVGVAATVFGGFALTAFL